jgi:hypothetical protein
MLVIRTLKHKISDFLNINMCFCLRLYGKQKLLLQNKVKYSKCNKSSNKSGIDFFSGQIELSGQYFWVEV